MKIGDKVVILTTARNKYIDGGVITEVKGSMITVASYMNGRYHFHKDTLLSDSKLRKIEVLQL